MSAVLASRRLRVFPKFCDRAKSDSCRSTGWVSGGAGVSKIWQALKDAELRREPAVAAQAPSPGEGLSAQEEAALCALLAHGSVRAAAEACGLTQGALESWLRTPRFVAVYHAASRAARARR